jgi:hypothetical protein
MRPPQKMQQLDSACPGEGRGGSGEDLGAPCTSEECRSTSDKAAAWSSEEATEENSQQRVRVVTQEVAKLVQCHSCDGVPPVFQVPQEHTCPCPAAKEEGRAVQEEGHSTWLYPGRHGWFNR